MYVSVADREMVMTLAEQLSAKYYDPDMETCDVAGIVNAFSNFGLQSEQIAYSNAHPDNAQSANLSSYLPWLIGGGVLALFLLLR